MLTEQLRIPKDLVAVELLANEFVQKSTATIPISDSINGPILNIVLVKLEAYGNSQDDELNGSAQIFAI